MPGWARPGALYHGVLKVTSTVAAASFVDARPAAVAPAVMVPRPEIVEPEARPGGHGLAEGPERAGMPRPAPDDHAPDGSAAPAARTDADGPEQLAPSGDAAAIPPAQGGAQPTAFSDPQLPSYWHLQGNTGTTRGINVTGVWADYQGTGVVAGIIDTGVDYLHPDLVGHYDQTRDFDAAGNDSDAFASTAGDNHGTAVIGVLGADLDNGIGGAGVAPDATLTAYRVSFGAGGESELLANFSRIAQLDVVNNSYGYGGFLFDNFQSSTFSAIGAQLDNALATGRGGLGTVVVFAAGNDRDFGQNTNYHGFQNDRGIITVAATDPFGNVASFSTPGASILVAAPGVAIATTDRTGGLGYSAGDYTAVSGTSFAAPAVAGVAALMLDANPNLGWRDVQEILASTAVLTGAGGFATNAATNWNGGGMHFSHDLGFGLVDAMAAVRVAESWRNSSTSANEAVAFSTAQPNLGITDFNTTLVNLTLSGGVRIDRVEVSIALQHTWIGDLTITLTGPQQTLTSVLFANPPTSQDNIVFTFSTTAFWGQDSAGTWSVRVTDGFSQDVGVLQSVGVHAYGDLGSDDTYTYTDEFSAYAAGDMARRMLSDGGGTDTINTAAIASNTQLDLRPGQVSQIDGIAVTTDSGTLIERADTGDGNDTVRGNTAANSLRGWRGDDQLFGETGNDTLEGGAGTDTLDGGAGNDYLAGGGGNDLYANVDAGDQIVEDANQGTDTITTAASSYALNAVNAVENLAFTGTGGFLGTGNGLANALTGGSGKDSLNGGAGNDTLIGNAGDDTLDGGAGFDSMVGGLGDDVYYFDTINYFNTTSDVAVELAGGGTDTVIVTVSPTFTYLADPNVEIVTYIGTGNFQGTGNELNNTITGGIGNDYLSGGNGGADLLIGGDGDDRYAYDPNDTIVELPGGGIDTIDLVLSGTPVTLVDGIENLSALTTSNNQPGLAATGNAAANHISVSQVAFGQPTNDTLNGAAGNDTLVSGTGNDLLTGGSGDDSLDGGTGTDTAVFSGTFAAYAIDFGNIGGLTVTHAGGGTDGTDTLVDIELLQFADQLIAVDSLPVIGTSGDDFLITGSSNNAIAGLAGNDTLGGGAGDDTLTGGAGNDTIDGGIGTDTAVFSGNLAAYSISVVGGVMTISHTSGGIDGIDTLTNVEQLQFADTVVLVDTLPITGTSGNDVLTGGSANNTINGLAGNDTLTGAAGDDTLDGGAGFDSLIGGLGDDILYFDNTNDVAVELAGQGTDTVIVTGSIGYSYILGSNIENLTYLGTASFHGTGNELNNTITGGIGDDYLHGGNGGADLLIGGNGDDHYDYDPNDTIVELPGGGIDTITLVPSGTPAVLVDGIENLFAQVTGFSSLPGLMATGNAAANNITLAHAGFNQATDDTLNGAAGNDTLVSDYGNDRLIGGSGDDSLDGGTGTDTAVFSGTFAAYSIGFGGGGLIVTHNSGGTDGTDSLVGIEFLQFADQLVTVDSLPVIGTSGDDLLTAGAGNNTITALAGNDTLDGGAGDDTLTGGAGNDLITGGTGTDTALFSGNLAAYAISTVNGVVTVSHTSGGADGVDTVTGVERLQFADAIVFIGTASNDSLTGTAGNDSISGLGGEDTLIGNAGNDTLDGGAGFDSLTGGAGDDTYYFDRPGDRAVELAGGGTDTVIATDNGYQYFLDPNVEILTFTGSSNFFGTGNELNNTIQGGVGADTIDGLGGADLLVGGAGNDVYIYDSLDTIVELPGGGIDTIYFVQSAPVVLPDEVENLELSAAASGALPVVVTGNAAANQIRTVNGGLPNGTVDTLDGAAGNDTLFSERGNDRLIGGAGDDNLDGGAGTDTAVFSGNFAAYSTSVVNGVVTVTHTAGGADGTDTLANIEFLQFADTLVATDTLPMFGTSGDDLLSGTAGNNTISGLAGNDTLAGGAGADSLDGGSGIDTADYSSALAGVTVSLATGAGTGGDAQGDTLAGIENVTGSSQGDALTGDTLANALTGGAGNDTLTGGSGNDTLDGGAGTDTAVFSGNYTAYTIMVAGGVATITHTSGGADGVDSLTNVELLQFADLQVAVGALPILGTTGDDQLAGNSNANSLNGLAGNDTLVGGAGADTLDGAAGVDTVDYAASATGVTVNLTTGIGTGGDAQGDVLAGVENLTGSAQADALTGDGFTNVLTGNAGNDTLSGNAGDDTLVGGAGADMLNGATGMDTASYAGSGSAVVIGLAANVAQGGDAQGDVLIEIDHLIATAFNDSLYGGGGDNHYQGLAGNDLLNGGGGNDTLDGGAGVDVMMGGSGDDTYVVDNASDSVQEGAPEDGTDTIQTTLTSYTLPTPVERLIYTGGAAFTGTGTASANQIIGGSGNDTLTGAAGNDTLDGGNGTDRAVFSGTFASYAISAANGVITVVHSGGDGTDSLSNIEFLQFADITVAADALPIVGGSGNDTLTGTSGNDSMVGAGGDDTLSGAAGADTLDGGAGSDTASYAGSASGVTVSLLSNTGSGGDAQGDVLSGIENLIGSAQADSLTGNAGANQLDGGAGADTLTGGAGDDAYIIDAADTVVELSGGGTDRASSAASFTLAAEVEHGTALGGADLSISGNGSDNALTGNAGANALSGGGGNDTLDGGAGNDTLTGGAGDDTYLVDSGGDSVVETAGGGTDTVRTGAQSLTLATEVENLVYTGAGSFAGTGNTLANSLTGGTGSDTLTGGSGNDTLNGGAGTDTAVFSGTYAAYTIVVAGGVATITHTGGGADGIDSLTNVELLQFADLQVAVGALPILGTSGDDLLSGNANANSLSGLAGNDTLVGGAGADTLDGAAGVDTADYAASAAGVSVNLATGTGSGGDAQGDSLTGVENLTGSAQADALTGDGGANLLTGNAGNDTIGGNAGDDTLSGGAGADVLNGGAGMDTASYAGSSAAVLIGLAANVADGGDATGDVLVEIDHLIATAFNDSLYGGGGDNHYQGLAGNDLLNGGGGNDTLDGGTGTDTMMGGNGADTYVVDSLADLVSETGDDGATDVLQTSLSSYTLPSLVESLVFVGSGSFNGTGSTANNLLVGGAGDDSLTGAAGNDTLDGGAGTDVARFSGNFASYTIAPDTITSGAFTVTHNGGGNDGVDTLSNVEFVQFADLLVPLVGGSPTAGDDLLLGNGGNDTIGGLDGNDSLLGLGGNDTLDGGTGGDLLDGGAGVDVMTGGAGNDIYIVDNAGDTVTELAGGGTDTVRTGLASLTLASETELLLYTGAASFAGTGNAAANTLTGGASEDTLDGAGGNDQVNGGSGDDRLVGGGGNDSIDGGTGTDTAVFSGNYAAYAVVVAAGVATVTHSSGGVDGVDTLTNVELLQFADILVGVGSLPILGTTGDDLLTGNANANSLSGLAGNDTLVGGGGSDTLEGGSGVDTADYATSTAAVSVSLATGAGSGGDAQGDSLTGVENLTGTSQADVLTGDGGGNLLAGGGGNDTLTGGNGDDTLTGGAGGDVLNGGAGSDTANYSASTSAVLIGLAANVAQGGDAQGDTLIDIDHLIASAFDDSLFGGAGDNLYQGLAGNDMLYGGGGNDTLDGGVGNDTLSGGDGNDSYVVDSAGDTINESAGGGTDTISSAINFTLGNELEDLVLTGASLTGTGNAVGNHITGNAGDNTLDGRGGADTLAGGAGNDILVFRAGEANGDVITDFAGNGAAAGDSLRFEGFSAGTTLTQVGATDTYMVGGETIQIVGAFSLHPTDYVFT